MRTRKAVNGTDWMDFFLFFAGRPYAGGRSRRRRGLGWQCPKKQTGSISSLFPACDSWLVGGIGAMVVDEVDEEAGL